MYNQEWSIQRHRQHWTHKTHDKTNKTENRTIHTPRKQYRDTENNTYKNMTNKGYRKPTGAIIEKINTETQTTMDIQDKDKQTYRDNRGNHRKDKQDRDTDNNGHTRQR